MEFFFGPKDSYTQRCVGQDPYNATARNLAIVPYNTPGSAGTQREESLEQARNALSRTNKKHHSGQLELRLAE